MKIDRFQYLRKEIFIKEYLKKNRPVIITGLADEWPARSKWLEEGYLEKVIGNKRVTVTISKDKTVVNPDKGWKYKQMHIPFMDFIRLLNDEKEKKIYYYLEAATVENLSPMLLEDFNIPECIPRRASKVQTNLWIGSGGNINPIHYDFSSNFLTQIKGEKRVLLFPPSMTDNLYGNMYNIRSKSMNLSPFNLINPDYEKYPKAKDATPIEVILKEGEMLFIPIFWWHFVETLAMEKTISLNFWWRGPKRDYLLKKNGWRIMAYFLYSKYISKNK
ncbi:cupin-like domain-containing protein [Paenibacillus sp. RRE4]|uniref:cupin-like domain-containing protein n=1 Tax=Paenibacillus sp. RRE4 TaxID=2962587 RepID=UPI00288174A5|nr:cupin-like domain-containing protein [Paenibacillus sp. RRE4]MDT0125306.1 cupin-like domain-containing protein [Paenibacillus sp. RRE4]